MASVYQPTYTSRAASGERVTRRCRTWRIELRTANGQRLRIRGSLDEVATRRLARILEEREEKKRHEANLRRLREMETIGAPGAPGEVTVPDPAPADSEEGAGRATTVATARADGGPTQDTPRCCGGPRATGTALRPEQLSTLVEDLRDLAYDLAAILTLFDPADREEKVAGHAARVAKVTEMLEQAGIRMHGKMADDYRTAITHLKRRVAVFVRREST